MYNVNDLFTVDAEVFKLNDPRVQALRFNQITQAEFMRLQKQDDPFVVQQGKLMLVTKQMQEQSAKGYVDHYKQQMRTTGGLTGKMLLDSKDAILKVYPEMKTTFDMVEDEIKRDNCQGCALNRVAGKLVEQINTLPPENRDIDSISGLSDMAKNKLKRKEIKVDDIPVSVPTYIYKKDIPMLKDNEQTTSVCSDDLTPTFREQCNDCGIKHLSTAIRLLEEVLQGYTPEKGHPQLGLALGDLNEAANEIMHEKPEVAEKIRNIRLKIMQQKGGV